MSENRFGEAVSLLMDAATLLNNQGDTAKRINEFIGTVHPAECVVLPEEGRWTSVDDRLPKDGGDYLVVLNGNVETCEYFNVTRTWDSIMSERVVPTHWMPLPSLPPQRSEP